jgi:hypothetical protein
MIVDRIEDGVAVLETEGETGGEERTGPGPGTVSVPVAWIPAEAREGSVLRLALERQGQTSRLLFSLDLEAMRAREQRIRQLRASIPEGPGGDLAL